MAKHLLTLHAQSRHAAKEYACDSCKGVIALGEEYICVQNEVPGHYKTRRMHLKCGEMLIDNILG